MTKEIVRNSIHSSIETISAPSVKLTLEKAWDTGLNVKGAFKREPQLVHMTLTALLKDAVDYLEMNKSFRHEGDYIEAVTYLIDEFPVMKLEEWKVICTRLKAGYYGKMYERLKLPELVEIFKSHESERAEYMERQHERSKAQAKNLPPITPEQQAKWKAFVSSLDLPKRAPKRGDFIPYPNSDPEQYEKDLEERIKKEGDA